MQQFYLVALNSTSAQGLQQSSPQTQPAKTNLNQNNPTEVNAIILNAATSAAMFNDIVLTNEQEIAEASNRVLQTEAQVKAAVNNLREIEQTIRASPECAVRIAMSTQITKLMQKIREYIPDFKLPTRDVPTYPYRDSTIPPSNNNGVLDISRYSESGRLNCLPQNIAHLEDLITQIEELNQQVISRSGYGAELYSQLTEAENAWLKARDENSDARSAHMLSKARLLKFLPGSFHLVKPKIPEEAILGTYAAGTLIINSAAAASFTYFQVRDALISKGVPANEASLIASKAAAGIGKKGVMYGVALTMPGIALQLAGYPKAAKGAGNIALIAAGVLAAKDIYDIGENPKLNRDQKNVQELRTTTTIAGTATGVGIVGFGVGFLVGAGILSNPVGWVIGTVGGLGAGIGGAHLGHYIGTGIFWEKPQTLVEKSRKLDDEKIKESVAESHGIPHILVKPRENRQGLQPKINRFIAERQNIRG